MDRGWKDIPTADDGVSSPEDYDIRGQRLSVHEGDATGLLRMGSMMSVQSTMTEGERSASFRLLSESRSKASRMEKRLRQKDDEIAALQKRIEQLEKVKQATLDVEAVEVDHLISEAVRMQMAEDKERHLAEKVHRKWTGIKDASRVERMKREHKTKSMQLHETFCSYAAALERSLMAAEDQRIDVFPDLRRQRSVMRKESIDAISLSPTTSWRMHRTSSVMSPVRFEPERTTPMKIDFGERVRLSATDDALVEAKLGTSGLGTELENVRDKFRALFHELKSTYDAGINAMWSFVNTLEIPPKARKNYEEVHKETKKLLIRSKQQGLEAWRGLNASMLEICAQEKKQKELAQPTKATCDQATSAELPDPVVKELVDKEQHNAEGAARRYQELEALKEALAQALDVNVQRALTLHNALWSAATTLQNQRFKLLDPATGEKMTDPIKSLMSEKDKGTKKKIGGGRMRRGSLIRGDGSQSPQISEPGRERRQSFKGNESPFLESKADESPSPHRERRMSIRGRESSTESRERRQSIKANDSPSFEGRERRHSIRGEGSPEVRERRQSVVKREEGWNRVLHAAEGARRSAKQIFELYGEQVVQRDQLLLKELVLHVLQGTGPAEFPTLPASNAPASPIPMSRTELSAGSPRSRRLVSPSTMFPVQSTAQDTVSPSTASVISQLPPATLPQLRPLTGGAGSPVHSPSHSPSHSPRLGPLSSLIAEKEDKVDPESANSCSLSLSKLSANYAASPTPDGKVKGPRLESMVAAQKWAEADGKSLLVAKHATPSALLRRTSVPAMETSRSSPAPLAITGTRKTDRQENNRGSPAKAQAMRRASSTGRRSKSIPR